MVAVATTQFLIADTSSWQARPATFGIQDRVPKVRVAEKGTRLLLTKVLPTVAHGTCRAVSVR